MATQNNVSNLVTVENIPFSVTITAAELLAANTTPVTLIPAQGAGLAIVVNEISLSMVYGTATYATNGVVNIITDTAGIAQATATANGFLFGTVSRTVKATPVNPTTTTQTQLIANKNVVLTVATGNPTAGDSVITVQGTYSVISA